MALRKKKYFVLDTNVILHDSSCIHQFEEHDVIIPIVVLEELDQFKKGHDSLNFHAREFLRILDSLSDDKIFNGGVRIGPGKGMISIKLDQPPHQDLTPHFQTMNPDHKILNTAYHLFKNKSAQTVILVTKDVNLRLKAKALGLMAQDYRNDCVEDVTSLYTGARTVEFVPEELIKRLYKDPFAMDPSELEWEHAPIPNEYFVLRNGKMSALTRYDFSTNSLRKIEKDISYGVTPRNAEQIFALNALLDDNLKLVTLTGKAGTGKTLLALAAALERRRNYHQILLARPVVPLSNKDLGFLPGDVNSKLEPYMQPLYDNLGVLRFNKNKDNTSQINKFLEEEKLVITPLAYIRGRSLVKMYFIVDEAQNLTPHEIKTIITRAGEGAKVVMTGDIFQIDHPYLDSSSNGLSYLIEKMQGQPLYAHVNLTRGERSELADLASNLL
ncbi:PhoH family protein [Candidatus Sumerlaeota bacterium]|nr:PhoH family protein [Candidatus Sumerlaeota bacterium]